MANVSIRMDDNLKKQAEDLFNDLGMNLTTAFTIFVKQAIREQGIPFEITREIPNSETISAINEVQQMKQNPSLGKSIYRCGQDDGGIISMKYTVKPTSKFQKDLKRIQKRGYDMRLMTDIIKNWQMVKYYRRRIEIIIFQEIIVIAENVILLLIGC